MTQLSIFQFANLFAAADPVMHFILLAGILFVLFEVALLLGDLIGSREDGRGR
jgi:Sec-independent protein secretion pathway component TatC